MNVEFRTEAAQSPEKEYINGIFVAMRGILCACVGLGPRDEYCPLAAYWNMLYSCSLTFLLIGRYTHGTSIVLPFFSTRKEKKWQVCWDFLHMHIPTLSTITKREMKVLIKLRNFTLISISNTVETMSKKFTQETTSTKQRKRIAGFPFLLMKIKPVGFFSE